MKEALRPMSLGEILDRTFNLYRARFFVFLVVAAMPLIAKMALMLVGLIVRAFLGQTTLPSVLKHQLDSGIDGFISRIASSVFSVGIWFVFVFLTAQIVTEDSLGVRLAFSKCFARWRGWLLLSGLLWLIGTELPHQLRTSRFLIQSWLYLPFWLNSILSTLEGFVLLAPLFLSIPVWALEKQPPLKAIARSWTLSRRAYGKMFMAWLVKDLIAFSIALLLSWLTYLLLRLAMGSHWNFYNSSQTMLWISLPSYIASILIGPLFPIALTLIYYDQRIRLEGYDIEWMMDAAGMNPPATELVPTADAGPATMEESQG